MTKPNIVQLQKARITVTQSMQQLKTQTAALQKAAKGDPEVTRAIKHVQDWTTDLNKKLIDVLDKALNEHDPNKQAALYKSALQAAGVFMGGVNTDRTLTWIKKNPIQPVPAVSSLTKSITSLFNALS